MFFDDGGAAWFRCCHAMWQALRQVGVAADSQLAPPAVNFNIEITFEHVKEALRWGWSEFAGGFEFGGVLGESCANSGTCVHDGGAGFHSCQRGSNERVGSEKEMVVFLGATRLTKIMHGTSFFEIRWKLQVVRTSAIRIRSLLPRLLPQPILLVHG